MRKLIFFATLLFFMNSAKAQHTTVPLFKPNADIADNPFTSIKGYDLMLACRAYDNVNHTISFNLLVLKGGHWQKLTNKQPAQTVPLSVTEPAFKQVPADDKQCDSLYQAFIATKLFTMNDDSSLPKCNEALDVVNGEKQVVSHTIEDGSEYRVWIATPKKMRYLYYYAPDFFAKYCPGKKGRIEAAKIAELFSKGW